MTFATKAFAGLFGLTLAAFAIQGCNQRNAEKDLPNLQVQMRQNAIEKLDSGTAEQETTVVSEPRSSGFEGDLVLTRNDALNAYVGTLTTQAGDKYRVQLPYDDRIIGNFGSKLDTDCLPTTAPWCYADVTAKPVSGSPAWQIEQIYNLTSQYTAEDIEGGDPEPLGVPMTNLPAQLRIRADVLAVEEMADGNTHVLVDYTKVSPSSGLPIAVGMEPDYFGINGDTKISGRKMRKLKGYCVEDGCNIEVTLNRGSDGLYNWAAAVHDIDRN